MPLSASNRYRARPWPSARNLPSYPGDGLQVDRHGGHARRRAGRGRRAARLGGGRRRGRGGGGAVRAQAARAGARGQGDPGRDGGSGNQVPHRMLPRDNARPGAPFPVGPRMRLVPTPGPRAPRRSGSAGYRRNDSEQGGHDGGHRRHAAAAEGPGAARRFLHRRAGRDRAGAEVGRQPRGGRAGRREQRVVERDRLAGTAADALLRAHRAAPDHPVAPGPLLRRGDVRGLGTGQRGPAGLADELASPGRRRPGRRALPAVSRPSDPRLPGPGGAAAAAG